MRSATVIIGGKERPVKGLSVRQSLKEDTGAYESKDPVKYRMRKVAIALQNADAFLPDPNNPAGEFKSSQRSTDDVVDVLDSDGVFLDMEEWFEAEKTVRLLGSKPQPVTINDEVDKKSEGESTATE